MQSISIKRYPKPTLIGWAGFLEPADKLWIAFIDLDGRPTFFLNRDPESGCVLPDDPTERDAALLTLAHEQKRREAWARGESYEPEAPPITYATAIHDAGWYVGTAIDEGVSPPRPIPRATAAPQFRAPAG